MRLTSALALPLLCLAARAHAQSDREVAERAIETAARVCPGHADATTGPIVRAIPVGALRVLAQHDAVLCPDRRLEGDVAVVFSPDSGVFRWTPDVPASSSALAQVVDTITRSEEFPVETAVWNAKGESLREQLAPMFEPRPNAPLKRFLHRRARAGCGDAEGRPWAAFGLHAHRHAHHFVSSTAGSSSPTLLLADS